MLFILFSVPSRTGNVFGHKLMFEYTFYGCFVKRSKKEPQTLRIWKFGMLNLKQ